MNDVQKVQVLIDAGFTDKEISELTEFAMGFVGSVRRVYVPPTTSSNYKKWFAQEWYKVINMIRK